MVITEKKDLEEVLDSLSEYKNLVVLGCSECAAVCNTGGEEETAEMAEILKEKGKDIKASLVLSTGCNDLITKKELKQLKEAIDSSDAVVSLACGNGVQTVSDLISIPVIPANNTVFVGERVRAGIFKENCRTCGQCVLGRTAAVCPVTKCAKGLLDGPCGGSTDGACEVNPENDCAWVLIYNRLNEMGKLYLLEEIQPIRDYSSSSVPRKIDRKKR